MTTPFRFSTENWTENIQARNECVIVNTDVDSVGPTVIPRYVLFRFPDSDGASIRGYFNLNGITLAVNDVVRVRKDNDRTDWEIASVNGNGGTAPGGAVVDRLYDPTLTNVIALSGNTPDSVRGLEGTYFAAESHGWHVNPDTASLYTEGDVGLINEIGEYERTTTQAEIGNWVVSLGIQNSMSDPLYVTNQGRVRVKYTGSAPSAGDYLVTSTTGGQAIVQAFMSPAVFAIAQDTGSAGLVDAILITKRVFVAITSGADIFALASGFSSTQFASTINGAPTATTVTYGAVTGNADSVIPRIGGEHGKMVLHNTTRGTSRLVVTTAGSTFTTVSSTDSWASGDAIQMNSLTTVAGGAPFFYDIQIETATLIPELTTHLYFQQSAQDSGATARFRQTHPFESFVSAKAAIMYTASTANIITEIPGSIPLIDRTFCIRWQSAGVGGGVDGRMKISGVMVAQA